ncbi:nucleotidyltransferase [Spirochaetia bacterium]|nr:nucleotidyltransferase [Spirochaetia bacterium]
MSISTMFSDFLSNLAITNMDSISNRYGELTAVLNKKFRNTESKTANTLQVGSFGRNTGVNGISDLDMLYTMPKTKWDDYKDNRQSKLLQDVRSAILDRYPRTDIRVDRCVVTVTYTDFHIEVQPVFEQDDMSYKYPDTKNGGSWKITKPREEMSAIATMDNSKNGNLRSLCKMARAWKNKHGVNINGLLIDTLVYNYLGNTNEYDNSSFGSYDDLSRDFFEFLSNEPDKSYYLALGSNQQVKVKEPFQKKSKKTYELCLEAIEAENSAIVNDKWKEIYGRPFPAHETINESASFSKEVFYISNKTEEYIEDQYPVDIHYSLKIDCEVKQNGFREHRLAWMLANRVPLLAKKSLSFFIDKTNVPCPYEVKWKVLNRGEEAVRRNCIRGQILSDNGKKMRYETTNFRGDHFVECYIIKDGVVVAKDKIDVPICSNG